MREFVRAAVCLAAAAALLPPPLAAPLAAAEQAVGGPLREWLEDGGGGGAAGACRGGVGEGCDGAAVASSHGSHGSLYSNNATLASSGNVTDAATQAGESKTCDSSSTPSGACDALGRRQAKEDGSDDDRHNYDYDYDYDYGDAEVELEEKEREEEEFELGLGASFGVAQSLRYGGAPGSDQPPPDPAVHSLLERTLRYMEGTGRAGPRGRCRNLNSQCSVWAVGGECDRNVDFMRAECGPACQLCDHQQQQEEEEEGWDDDEEEEEQIFIGVRQIVSEEGGDHPSPAVLALLEQTFQYMDGTVRTDPRYDSVRGRCSNSHEMCTLWALGGECSANEAFMASSCGPACQLCHLLPEEDADAAERRAWLLEDRGGSFGVGQILREGGDRGRPGDRPDPAVLDTLDRTHRYITEANVREPCTNLHKLCSVWATKGECHSNIAFMESRCMAACQICDVEEDEQEGEEMEGKEGNGEAADEVMYLGVPQVLHREGDPAGPSQDALDLLDRTVEYMNGVVKKDPRYSLVRRKCRNKLSSCTLWALDGECNTNVAYMMEKCGPACQRCHPLHDAPDDDPCQGDPADNALGPGELDQLFEGIVYDTTRAHTTTRVLSRPAGSARPGEDENGRDSDRPEDGPWLVVFDDFLTLSEADRLVELAGQEGWKRSSSFGARKKDGKGEKKEGHSEKSYDATPNKAFCERDCYEDEVTRGILAKVEALTGVPENNNEPLQLLKYEEGSYHITHNDYLPIHVERTPGNRILTLFMYLSEVEEGGGTHFNRIGDAGTTVLPKKGRAVLWPSVLNEDPTEMDPLTEHEALPVISGTKYGANVWIHQRDYKTPGRNGCYL